MGNILTRHAVRKINLKGEGVSTLGARKIWYDEVVNRLNIDSRGKYLGQFKGSDKILAITKSGTYKLSNFDLSNHFDDDVLIIEKFNPNKIITAVYFDGESQKYYVKRFQVEDTDKKQSFLDEHPDTYLSLLSIDYLPRLSIIFDKDFNKRKIENEELSVTDFTGIKGIKAKGKKLTSYFVKELRWLDPLPYETENNENIEETPSFDIKTEKTPVDPDAEVIQGTLF